MSTRANPDWRADSPPLVLERFIPYRLTIAAQIVSERLAGKYTAEHGISVTEARVITTLGQYPDITARDIVRHGHLGKTLVSRSVATLNRRGLVSERQSTDDRRAMLLTLTMPGREIYLSLARMAEGYSAEIESVLGEEDLATLNSVVDRLIRHYDDRKAAVYDRFQV